MAFFGFVLLAVYALSPSRAEAQCAQWTAAPDRVDVVQGNGLYVYLLLQQKGMGLTGEAWYNYDHGLAKMRGQVYGGIQGDDFTFQIHWNNKDRGLYQGKIDSHGEVTGVTASVISPKAKANWRTARPLKCGELAPAPVATPKPIKKIGNPVKPPAPAGAAIPTPPPHSEAGVPGITASPKAVSIPAGQSQGTTTLTWDGGADHAYAEVWVQVDDGDEKFVVEKGKGTRTVPVERGKTYLYILTDSGQRLATVTVKTK